MNLINNCTSPIMNIIFKYNICRCAMYITRLKKSEDLSWWQCLPPC